MSHRPLRSQWVTAVSHLGGAMAPSLPAAAQGPGRTRFTEGTGRNPRPAGRIESYPPSGAAATVASGASEGGARLEGSQGLRLEPDSGRDGLRAEAGERGRAALQRAVPVGDVLEDEPAGHEDA